MGNETMAARFRRTWERATFGIDDYNRAVTQIEDHRGKCFDPECRLEHAMEKLAAQSMRDVVDAVDEIRIAALEIRDLHTQRSITLSAPRSPTPN